MKAPLALFLILIASCCAFAQQAGTTGTPAVDQWVDTFDGNNLDAAKWEKFSFEGPSGAALSVKDGVLKIRGIENARAGARSVTAFNSDKFIVEVAIAAPPKAFNQSTGFASLTVLFDTAGRNRVEWMLRSDGVFEAWYVKDGRGERLDNKRMGTKEQQPSLAIVRRGDTILFVLNGEVGLQKKAADLPREFHVMLYGWGNSESSWDSVRVVTAK